MSLDDLIPFIIFLGFILFNVLKRLVKNKQAKQEKEPSEKPAKKKAFGLSKIVDKIKAELELAGIELKQQQDKAKALTRDAEFAEEESGNVGFADDDLEEILREETGSSVQEPEKHEELPEFARKVEEKSKPIVSEPAYDIKKRKQGIRPKLSASKMREAIVLSEILAKPVGLREEPF